MRSFIQEFRRFALKGNALELAVAVIVGNAFGQIVNSLVSDIITPLLGLLTSGHTDIKNLALVLRPAEIVNGGTLPPLAVNYGSFVDSIFNFLIIALSIFLVFKGLSLMRRRFFKSGEEARTPPEEKPPQERLLEEIRDLLARQSR